jgi:hypothetical protein
MGGRWIVAAALVGLVAASRAGAARLAVTASRPEVLYSSGAANSCSDLSKVTDDAALPFYIVRLKAAAPAGVPADQVRYEWSFPKPALGMLLADADLGPGEQDPAIRSLCAELGNECVLTAEQLAVYNKPSILWVAPGCDVLPADTSRQFRGGRVRIAARASVGRRRLGKGTATIGFGRLGSLELFVKDPGEKHFRDGIGKPGGEKIFINPDFAVRLDSSGIPSPVETITIDSGGGGSVDVTPPCALDGSFTACTTPGDIDYSVGGKPRASATAVLMDGSALCDGLTVNIRTTTIIPKLEVSLSPKRGQYVPGDPRSGSVNLRVTLRDASPPGSGGNILLKGSILTCDSEVRVGRSTISKTTQIDLQHCSATVRQPCGSDADCRAPSCKDCVANEICLSASHCSNLFLFPPTGCTSDRDCRPPRCRGCNPSDTCIQVLPLQQIFLGVGDSVDLVKSTIPVINTLPAAARVTDMWTAHTFNAGDDSDVVKYKIAPRPDVKP